MCLLRYWVGEKSGGAHGGGDTEGNGKGKEWGEEEEVTKGG